MLFCFAFTCTHVLVIVLLLIGQTVTMNVKNERSTESLSTANKHNC